MLTRAELKLNPFKQVLTGKAKKRLKWMYIIHFECNQIISKAAKKSEQKII